MCHTFEFISAAVGDYDNGGYDRHNTAEECHQPCKSVRNGKKVWKVKQTDVGGH